MFSVFTYVVSRLIVTAKDGNASQNGVMIGWCVCNKSQASWKRSKQSCIPDAFSVDVMTHTWKRKFVFCSEEKWLEML